MDLVLEGCVRYVIHKLARQSELTSARSSTNEPNESSLRKTTPNVVLNDSCLSGSARNAGLSMAAIASRASSTVLTRSIWTKVAGRTVAITVVSR